MANCPAHYFLNTGVPHVVVPVRRRGARGRLSDVGRSIRYHAAVRPQRHERQFHPVGTGRMRSSCAPTNEASREKRLPAARARRPAALIHAEMQRHRRARAWSRCEVRSGRCAAHRLSSARGRSSLNTSRWAARRISCSAAKSRCKMPFHPCNSPELTPRSSPRSATTG